MFLVQDSAGPDCQRFSSTVSLRGYLEGNIKVSVLKQGMHSGVVGGIIPDSFRIMRSLQSRIEDEKTGKVIETFRCQVPEDKLEFLKENIAILEKEDVYPTTDGLELNGPDRLQRTINGTWEPSLTIIGMDGFPEISSAGNVVRDSTACRFSMRTPPSLDVQKYNNVFKELLEANPPYNCKVEVTMDDPGQGFNAKEQDAKTLAQMKDTSKIFWNNEMLFKAMGGSIPFVSLIAKTYPETILFCGGIGYPNDNIHGPDENIHLEHWEKFTAAMTYLLSEL